MSIRCSVYMSNNVIPVLSIIGAVIARFVAQLLFGLPKQNIICNSNSRSDMSKDKLISIECRDTRDMCSMII